MERKKGAGEPPIHSRRSIDLMKRLLLAYRARMDDRLRQYGMTTAQLRVLLAVQEAPGVTGAELARGFHITPQSAQALVAGVVKRGWLERGHAQGNSRRVTLRITPTGEHLLGEAQAIFTELEDEVWAGVSAAQIQALDALVAQGVERLEKNRS